MINEICLYCHNDERTSGFKQESFAIPELYLVSIPKFDSKRVIKCNIFLWENRPFPPKEKILGSADSHQIFDFDKYISLSERDRKLMQLQIIHQGMLDIAVDYNWSKEPLEAAYQACLMSDLTFNKQIKKRKLSPNRKQFLSLWAYCDFYHFKISWVVSDRKENILKKGVLLIKEPHFIDMWRQLSFHWVDDDQFIVESDYKGLVTDIWEVDISTC